MKRIGRYIRNAFTVLSLVLCVAVLVLWLQSYVRPRALWTSENYCTTSAGGRLVLDNAPLLKAERARGLQEMSSRRSQLEARLRQCQAESRSTMKRHPTEQERLAWKSLALEEVELSRMLTAPGSFNPPSPAATAAFAYAISYAGLGLGASLLPLAWALSAARARQALRRAPRSGLCARCGYDLRATPERCPECGTIPAKAKAVKAGR